MQEWLVNLPELEGLWGMERFGLADIRVTKALEGLEGADECTSYKFVEERSTWAAEKAHLDKLVQSRSKQVRIMLRASHTCWQAESAPNRQRKASCVPACTKKVAACATEGYARQGQGHSSCAYRRARAEPRRQSGR